MAPLVQALGRADLGDDVVLLSTARAAFANGLARILLNANIVVWLLVWARVPSHGLKIAA